MLGAPFTGFGLTLGETGATVVDEFANAMEGRKLEITKKVRTTTKVDLKVRFPL